MSSKGQDAGGRSKCHVGIGSVLCIPLHVCINSPVPFQLFTYNTVPADLTNVVSLAVNPAPLEPCFSLVPLFQFGLVAAYLLYLWLTHCGQNDGASLCEFLVKVQEQFIRLIFWATIYIVYR